MKFFKIFSKENRDSKDTKPIQNKEGKDVAKSNRGHQSAIKGYENTIAENKKLKQARKIERKFAWEKTKTAIRLNLKNLTSLDDIGTEKQNESNRIKEDYEKRLDALNLSKEQKSILESGTYSKKTVRQSNKTARKGIRTQKRKIASNNRQAFLTKSLRKGRKVGLFALGVITSPAKYVTDGVVQGAKAADKWLGENIKHYKGGKNFAKNCVKGIFGNKEAQKAAKRAVGDTINAAKTSAMITKKYFDIRREQRRNQQKEAWKAAKISITGKAAAAR